MKKNAGIRTAWPPARRWKRRSRRRSPREAAAGCGEPLAVPWQEAGAVNTSKNPLLQSGIQKSEPQVVSRLSKPRRDECKYSIRTRYMDSKSRKLQYTYILKEELNLFLHFLKHNLKIKGLTYIQNINVLFFSLTFQSPVSQVSLFLLRHPLRIMHSFIQRPFSLVGPLSLGSLC